MQELIYLVQLVFISFASALFLFAQIIWQFFCEAFLVLLKLVFLFRVTFLQLYFLKGNSFYGALRALYKGLRPLTPFR